MRVLEVYFFSTSFYTRTSHQMHTRCTAVHTHKLTNLNTMRERQTVDGEPDMETEQIECEKQNGINE